MIRAQIFQNDKLIMDRKYHDNYLSLENVLKQLEKYVVNEQINTVGECLMRVRFENLAEHSYDEEIDLSDWKSHIYDIKEKN